jgi:hypothetical protein
MNEERKIERKRNYVEERKKGKEKEKEKER